MGVKFFTCYLCVHETIFDVCVECINEHDSALKDFYKLIGYFLQHWSSLVLHRASPDRILDIDITVTARKPGASVGWFTETMRCANSNVT